MKYRKRPSSIGCAFNEEAIERMLMAKFKKKPVVIEAHRVTDYKDDPESFQKLANWCMGRIVYNDEIMQNSIVIHTLEGDMTAFEGDWIIKGIEGEFYPCKNSIFKDSYEQVDW